MKCEPGVGGIGLFDLFRLLRLPPPSLSSKDIVLEIFKESFRAEEKGSRYEKFCKGFLYSVNSGTSMNMFDWSQVPHLKTVKLMLTTTRAVARPWRERRLSRAPEYRERQNGQIIFFNHRKL